MTNFTEIALSSVENDVHTPIKGLALKPYLEALNKIVGFTQLMEREAAKREHKSVPPQTIPLNIDEKARETGFRIMQHKIVLIGYWGEDHTRDSDLAAFGTEFPEVYMSITEAGMPKPNGDLSAVKNYIRRDYVAGECVATWTPQPIVWTKRAY